MIVEADEDARAWDVVRDDLERQGLCLGCAARAAWARPTSLCQTCEGIVTEQGRIVLRFVCTWTDWALHRDLDSALSDVVTAADRKALTGYLRLRRSTPGWAPNKVPCTSNARRVDRRLVDALMAPPAAPVRPCANCGSEFEPTSSRRSYCAESCRTAARRTRRRIAA